MPRPWLPKRCRSTRLPAAFSPSISKARRTQPPADVSAMDGYAVRASDVATAPARLKVIGEVPAGRPFSAESRQRRSRPYLHRRLRAGRRRHRRGAGIDQARRRMRRGAKGHHQGPQCPPTRARFPQGRHAVRQRPSADRTRPRAGCRHEPSVGAGSPQTQSRAVRHRRRAGAARHRARTRPDRLFERLCACRADPRRRRRLRRSRRRTRQSRGDDRGGAARPRSRHRDPP